MYLRKIVITHRLQETLYEAYGLKITWSIFHSFINILRTNLHFQLECLGGHVSFIPYC